MANAVQIAKHAGSLPSKHGLLFLSVITQGAVLFHFFNLIETLQGFFDGLEVGHHTTQPALSDKGLATGLCRLLGRSLSLLLGAYKENISSRGYDLGKKGDGLIQQCGGLIEVDYMNAVASLKDVRFHLRIPTTGLVSEVNTCFE